MRLDSAYDNTGAVAGSAAFPDVWADAAAAFRKGLGFRGQVGVPYGTSARQVYDFFQPAGISRGTVIFVHGGYWRRFDPSFFSHFAQGALAKGWAVALPGYDLCPTVSIAQITAQVGQAVAHVADRTQGTLALVGHSAGGHLVARMMDPLVLSAEVRGRITQVVPISPVSDLEPLLETSMNADFQLDPAMAAAESPVNMAPPHGVKVHVWVGADELPAFVEQAEGLGRVWGAPVTRVEGAHHFDVIDPLRDPDSDLMRAVLGAK